MVTSLRFALAVLIALSVPAATVVTIVLMNCWPAAISLPILGGLLSIAMFECHEGHTAGAGIVRGLAIVCGVAGYLLAAAIYRETASQFGWWIVPAVLGLLGSALAASRVSSRFSTAGVVVSGYLGTGVVTLVGWWCHGGAHSVAGAIPSMG